MQDNVQAQLAKLPSFTREQLLELWQKLHRKAAPPGIRRELMIPFLAYKIQENAYGGLKPATRAQLLSQQQPQGKPDPQAVEAARAAKGASLNGSPVPSAGTAGSKDEDLRSTIARQVYASVGGQRI